MKDSRFLLSFLLVILLPPVEPVLFLLFFFLESISTKRLINPDNFDASSLIFFLAVLENLYRWAEKLYKSTLIDLGNAALVAALAFCFAKISASSAKTTTKNSTFSLILRLRFFFAASSFFCNDETSNILPSAMLYIASATAPIRSCTLSPTLGKISVS
ncbi:hypothetical protein [Neisseria sicca]